MPTALLFSCIKNEGPFLLEWVNAHLALGFDHILLFSNDCEDGSDDMADHLASIGPVTHIRNDAPGQRGPQWAALNSPALRKALRQADWALHLDIDEFLNIRVGDGSLDALTEAVGSADAVSLPWRFFGNAGIMGFEDAPVTQQFTKCGPYPVMFPRQALMFKTLFRPSDRLERAGVHAPRLAKTAHLSDIDWRNGSGRPLSAKFNPKSPVMHGSDFGNELGQINHYALRSMESFLVKSERGLPNHGHVPVDMNYWVRRNFNDLFDDTLAARGIQDHFAGDATLKALHGAACDWHRTRIEAIVQTPQGVEFLAALASAGSTRVPSDPEILSLYQRLSAVFAKGAG